MHRNIIAEDERELVLIKICIDIYAFLSVSSVNMGGNDDLSNRQDEQQHIKAINFYACLIRIYFCRLINLMD